jgi:hypothetical protein
MYSEGIVTRLWDASYSSLGFHPRVPEACDEISKRYSKLSLKIRESRTLRPAAARPVALRSHAFAVQPSHRRRIQNPRGNGETWFQLVSGQRI